MILSHFDFGADLNSRERFLATLRCESTDVSPVWLMRQAGRHLPEYRELRKKHSFHTLVKTPDLACEVTMQPVRRYDLDAAIIFSDILVIPEALGQPYHFREHGGIGMEFKVDCEEAFEKLSSKNVEDHLSYVSGAIRNARKECGDSKALIGFGGSPWTLATYMVEGGSSKTYHLAKQIFYRERELFDNLMELVTDATIRYFRMQVDAGADVVQVFDSWGGVLAPDIFWDASGKWIKKIVDAVKDDVPVIVFSKGAHGNIEELIATSPNVLGADWTVKLPEFRRSLPDNIGVQGNLDPVLLLSNPELMKEKTNALLESMRGLKGHIVNLGHGVSPDAQIECVSAMVKTVKDFK